MKLEIQANDFCPDDCRKCEPYHSEYGWLCRNKDWCKNIAEALKEMKKQNEITHKAE